MNPFFFHSFVPSLLHSLYGYLPCAGEEVGRPEDRRTIRGWAQKTLTWTGGVGGSKDGRSGHTGGPRLHVAGLSGCQGTLTFRQTSSSGDRIPKDRAPCIVEQAQVHCHVLLRGTTWGPTSQQLYVTVAPALLQACSGYSRTWGFCEAEEINPSKSSLPLTRTTCGPPRQLPWYFLWTACLLSLYHKPMS